MSVQLTKDSIDLGIVTNDSDAAIGFYRDVLGLTDLGSMPMPGATMHLLQCGTSVIKIVATDRELPRAAPGGMHESTGYRYWTISVSNLEETVKSCAAVGRTIVVPMTELQPTVTIAIVEDPDGNWVELLQRS